VRDYLAALDAGNSVHKGDAKYFSSTDPAAAWNSKDGRGKFEYFDNYMIDIAHGALSMWRRYRRGRRRKLSRITNRTLSSRGLFYIRTRWLMLSARARRDINAGTAPPPWMWCWEPNNAVEATIAFCRERPQRFFSHQKVSLVAPMKQNLVNSARAL
jgi:hypothetical protein